MSKQEAIRNAARGVADARPIFAALSAAAFFLFFSVRVLESRRWLPSATS